MSEPWIAPKPTEYAGTVFRSRLESWWAMTLDSYEIAWAYEPKEEDGRYLTLELPSGARYRPDFWLTELQTILEVKGDHGLGAEKPQELARELPPEWTVIFGWAPQSCSEPGQPEYFMRWDDAAGGASALFGECPCGAWQWVRPRVSLDCRKCGQRLGAGVHLFGSRDDVPFTRSREISFASLFRVPGALCHGSALKTRFILTPRLLRLGTRQSAYSSAVAHTAPSIQRTGSSPSKSCCSTAALSSRKPSSGRSSSAVCAEAGAYPITWSTTPLASR